MLSTVVVRIRSYCVVIRPSISSGLRPVNCQATAITGMSMFGKMYCSTGTFLMRSHRSLIPDVPRRRPHSSIELGPPPSRSLRRAAIAALAGVNNETTPISDASTIPATSEAAHANWAPRETPPRQGRI